MDTIERDRECDRLLGRLKDALYDYVSFLELSKADAAPALADAQMAILHRAVAADDAGGCYVGDRPDIWALAVAGLVRQLPADDPLPRFRPTGAGRAVAAAALRRLKKGQA